MSKFNEEYFKQKVEYYRQWLTLLFAVEVGCAAWLAANYDKAAKLVVIIDILVLLVFFVILIFINLKIRDYIKRLRD